MMHGACSTLAALGRRLVEGVERSALLAAHLPATVAVPLESQRLLEGSPARLGVGRVGADAVEALQRVLGRNVRVTCDEGLVVDVHGDDLEAHPLAVGEAQASTVGLDLDPLRGQPLGPERDRLFGADAPHDRVHHAGAGTSAGESRILEEREVGAGASELVCVEQVVDGRVVLVDRLFDEPQTEHPRVEVDVAGCVGGDGGDVVDALELHRQSSLDVFPHILRTLR